MNRRIRQRLNRHSRGHQQRHQLSRISHPHHHIRQLNNSPSLGGAHPVQQQHRNQQHGGARHPHRPPKSRRLLRGGVLKARLHGGIRKAQQKNRGMHGRNQPQRHRNQPLHLGGINQHQHHKNQLIHGHKRLHLRPGSQLQPKSHRVHRGGTHNQQQAKNHRTHGASLSGHKLHLGKRPPHTNHGKLHF